MNANGRSSPERSGSLRVAGIAGLGVLWVCCIWATDEPYLAGEPLPPLELLEAVPTADGTPVGRRVPLGARFSDRVRPETVDDTSARLLLEGQEVDAATQVDLLDCTVHLVAEETLPPGASVTVAFSELEGFSSGPLSEPALLSFTTADGTAAPEPPLDPPSFEAVYERILGPRCAYCHEAYRPPGGLDLSSQDAALDSLLYGRSDAAGGRRYVVPGRHAESYLLWKVLGLPGAVGDPMPRTGDWPSDRACGTQDADLRLLADWIDGL